MSRSLSGLLIGRTLVGRYRIEELIGQGGMSVVFRALDQRLDRPVALKVVSMPGPGEGLHHELRERLRREAASAARIPPHPNVVQVYDHGTDPELDVDFIAMELLRGRDLKRALAAGAPPLAEALEILRDATCGVAAGHAAGIVHRDVKPSNIVLADAGGRREVKILDFGIAKALEAAAEDDLTRTGAVPHSPAYASPEQLRGESQLTAASDVYQLGLVGYQLLAGERPFDEAERQAAAVDPHRELPERGRWAEVPPELRSVIARALRPAPEERFSDAHAMLDALRAADADATALLAATPAPAATAVEEPLAPAPPAPSTRQPRPLRIDRRAALALGGVLALLGVWMLLGGGDDAGAGGAQAMHAAEVTALDQEFRPLHMEAFEALREESSPLEGEEAAEAVERAVLELNQSWVRGNIERHLSHYADQVRFYGRRLSRTQIARQRAETLVEYPEREITVERTAIRFPEPGTAEALVDKSWRFRGGGERWTGAARQELRFELQEGQWRVVAERYLEVFRSEHEDE